MKLQRFSGNPIVTPGLFDWRRAITFNPGVVLDDGKFYLFERAGGTIRPLKCQVGLLESSDGFHFRHAQDTPVFTPEALGCPQGTIEDPRVVKIDGTFYMIYAHRPYTYNCHPTGLGVPDYTPIKGDLDRGINNTRSGVAMSKDMRNWTQIGFTTPPEVDDRDNVLFPEKIGGRFALLRRPMSYVGPSYGCRGPSIWLSFSDDLRTWTDPKLVATAENPAWEGTKIGAAAPPMRTEAGWLMLYHGVDAKSIYRVGVMLLDLKDPSRVIARAPQFIMEPETYYEKFGLVIPNVVFPTANVIKGGTIYIYYGCTDTCISVATVALSEMLEFVLQHPVKK
jgi:beta-1,2-mannobiose phosphorylase / 1,2-beta-oligomannan phosphorylase